MTSKSPIFPVAEPQHYRHYGFDPQIDYFQVLEEARKHSNGEARSPDELHFKLQKPITKDDSARSSKNKKSRRWWWRNPLLFFRPKRGGNRTAAPTGVCSLHLSCPPSPCAYSRTATGPVYWTENGDARSGTTSRRIDAGGWGRSSSGPLRLSEMGDVGIPYLCLRDPAAMDASFCSACYPPAAAVPIYLVT